MSCWGPGQSQKSGAWSLRVGLGAWRCFLKIFFIFHQKNAQKIAIFPGRKCHVGSPVGPKNLELGAWSLRVGLGAWRCFLKIFLIFHQKQMLFFYAKKKVLRVAFGACESVFKTDT